MKRQRSEEQFRCGTGHAGPESGRNHSGRHRARASASQHAQKGTAASEGADIQGNQHSQTVRERTEVAENTRAETDKPRNPNESEQRHGKRSKRTKSKDIPSTNSKEKQTRKTTPRQQNHFDGKTSTHVQPRDPQDCAETRAGRK